jgi:hypothetical protein
VLRESLDDTLRHLLPWDIELVIDESVDEQEEEPGSLSVDCCYSNLLNLFRVKTRVCSYNLYATPFWSFPSQFTLVKLIKLKRTQTVCTEKERERERKREKQRKNEFFSFFSFFGRIFLAKKILNNKKNTLPPG